MTSATFVILAVAAFAFVFRLCVGPSVADRAVGLSGLVVVGMGAIATHAIREHTGAYLPTLVVVALVGPVSTAMVARYIEGRDGDR